METGELDVLNCGAGHLQFRFDKGSPDETEKARRVIQDMLNRGYSIFVETASGLRRVKRFNPKTDCYVVEEPHESDPKKKVTRQLPLRTTKATGVGRTAGG